MSANFAHEAGAPNPPMWQLCRRVTKHSPHPMVAVEGALHIVTYFNPAFSRLIGRGPEELLGRPFGEAVREGETNGCAALLDRVFDTGHSETLIEQVHLQTSPNPAFWSYSVWAILGDDERPAGVMIQVTDATETAQFRQQLVAMNEALMVTATHHHALAEESRSLNSQLQTALQTRDHFLAVLSHELRNPLAAIHNAVALASLTKSREHLEWSCEVTARQVKNFAHLIDDLLEVSRLSQGKIRLRKELVDIGSVVKHAVEAVTPLFEERNHNIRLSIADMKVEVDPIRLEQMLINLLGNAAKYTPSGGKIELIAGPEGKDLVCRVRDNGVGIAADLLPKMFDLFVQADRSLARSEGGLGIGLTLVRSLAELHGGSVAATSEGPDKGSEFVLRLPAAPVESDSGPGVAPTSGETVQVRGKRILAADDNEDTLRGMARLLRLSGHTVQVASNGPEAIAFAREFRPEVVILDIGLPGMDGYEVADRLRAEGFCEDALIIAASGYAEGQFRAHVDEKVFDHHLVKPVDLERLLSLVDRRESPPSRR